MSAIFQGRFTAQADKPVVLFLIGARFNRLRDIGRWWWFAQSMPAMLNELQAKPDSGLLWHRQYLSGRIIMVQQYWESFDKLLSYSQEKTAKHFPAWSRYMRELSKGDSVGIWHETYLIEPGKYECIYGNMPLFGLAAATNHVKAEGRLAAARDRMAVA